METIEPATNSASAKVITALIIGLLVGFAAGVFWQDRRGGNALPTNDTLAATVKEATGDKKAETPKVKEVANKVKGVSDVSSAGTTATSTVSVTNLHVVDQVAGDRVEIANLDAADILWAAVREEKDGKLGNILGAQKVFVGNGQKVTIELLRPTVTAGTYKVVLYKDIGTPAFNYREDIVVEGVAGAFTAK